MLQAAEEQLRTIAAMRFRVTGDTAEHAFESSVRLQRLIAITRDDRRKKDQGTDGPYFRIEASGQQTVRLSGRQVEVTVPATVHEPGVLFLKVTLFRRMLRALPERGFLAIQATGEGIMFGDVRLPLDCMEALLYPDAATAPERHPGERDDGPEQIPRHSENLFDP